ncbi:PIG-L family deacetylase, partial [candidate division KSB1 bacterium]
MHDVSFTSPPKSLLCLGAHPDDIEIGCGATLLKLIGTYENLSVKWIVFAAHGERAIEAKKSAELFLTGADKDVELKQFKDGFFPYDGREIKLYFEELKSQISPDIIFTHYRDDLHQDHRLISELTWNTFRNHLIFEYEIPKYDG